MIVKPFSIKDGAVFVADSHLNKKNTQLIEFLNKISSSKIETSQLILMGDIFDFLCEDCKYFIGINKEIINTLNTLSKKIEIIYLEGNHDYNLKTIFPNIKVIPRKKQPLIVKYGTKTISLAHGDNFYDMKYDIFCKVIRNKSLIKFLNFCDFNYALSKKIEKKLLEKNICHKIKDFKHLAQQRVSNYETDYVIEGHYHQGMTYHIKNKRYINAPSLCCDKMYLRLRDDDFRNVYL